jgi:hypothetical protein
MDEAVRIAFEAGLPFTGLPATTGLLLRRAALEEIAARDPASAAEGVNLGVRLHNSGLRAGLGRDGSDGPRG